MEVVAIVTARGGSKSIPGKNLVPLCGKPLIAWTIEAARNSPSVARVLMSTDDDRIAATARRFGAETPFQRPAELSQDASPHIDVVLHAVEWLRTHEDYVPDYTLLLQPTSPLRSSVDIEAAIRLAREKQLEAVVSVCEAREHPYLTQRIAEDGTLHNFVNHNLAYMRRQDLPPAVVFNGALYLTRRTALLEQRSFLPRGTVAYVMPHERSWDIDDLWDLAFVELVMNRMNSEGSHVRQAA
jgi:CMP-N,N'-diacetyllegionaminic acid synthase